MWVSRVLIEDQPHHGWVSIVLHPSLHHHLYPRHLFLPKPHPTTRQWAPPLSWGVWAQIQMPQLTSEARTIRTRPSLFQRDVGGFLDAWRRNRGVRNTRGDPGNGRPRKCVPEANHNESRGSFPPIPPSSPSYWQGLNTYSTYHPPPTLPRWPCHGSATMPRTTTSWNHNDGQIQCRDGE